MNRAINRSEKARARGFKGLNFKDLRSSHETILLDKNVPDMIGASAGLDGLDKAVEIIERALHAQSDRI